MLGPPARLESPPLAVPPPARLAPPVLEPLPAYASGLINSLDFGATTRVEKPFAVLATGPGGLATAGKYLFAEDGSGAWATHYTFAPDGTQISAVDWNWACCAAGIASQTLLETVMTS